MFAFEDGVHRLVFIVLVLIIILMLAVVGLFVHYTEVRADLQACEENRHGSADFP